MIEMNSVESERSHPGWSRWPSQGRLGLAHHGEISGDYIFIWPEIDGNWAFFTSSGIDDVLPGTTWLDERIRYHQIEWIPEGEQSEVLERELFGVRPIVASQFDLVPFWKRFLNKTVPATGERTRAAIEAWEQRIGRGA